jgi:hypothetical protein
MKNAVRPLIVQFLRRAGSKIFRKFLANYLTSFYVLGRIASMSCEGGRKAAYSPIPQDVWQVAKFFKEFWENYLTSLFVVSRIVTMSREGGRKAAYSPIPQKVWYNVLLVWNKFTPPPPPVPLKVSFSFYYYTFGFLVDWLNSLYCVVLFSRYIYRRFLFSLVWYQRIQGPPKERCVI